MDFTPTREDLVNLTHLYATEGKYVQGWKLMENILRTDDQLSWDETRTLSVIVAGVLVTKLTESTAQTVDFALQVLPIFEKRKEITKNERTKALLSRIKGDLWGIVARYCTDENVEKTATAKAIDEYHLVIFKDVLMRGEPEYLRATINCATFCYEFLNAPEQAFDICKLGFDRSKAYTPASSDEFEEGTRLMKELKGHVDKWF